MIYSRRARAFTLVELLVVIAIIAVLAALLLPVFAKGRAKAAETTCLSNQRQLAQMALMMSQDNNGVLPGTDIWSKMTIDQKLFRCPAGAAANGYLYNARAAGKGQDSFYLPTETLLFADGGTGDNLGHEPSDFDYRHLNHGLMATYADGHTARVAQGYAAVFYPGDVLATPEDARVQLGVDVRVTGSDAATPILLRELSRYTAAALAKTPGSPVLAHLLLTAPGANLTADLPPGAAEVNYGMYGIGAWTSALALYQVNSGALTLALTDTVTTPADTAAFRWTLHRGVYYAYRIGGGLEIPEATWTATNAAGFSYAAGAGKSPFPSEKTDGVIAEAGALSPTEDQAILFSARMVDPAYVTARGNFDPVIKAKTALLATRLAACNPAINDDFWRYLSKATAKKPAAATTPGGKPVYQDIEPE